MGGVGAGKAVRPGCAPRGLTAYVALSVGRAIIICMCVRRSCAGCSLQEKGALIDWLTPDRLGWPGASFRSGIAADWISAPASVSVSTLYLEHVTCGMYTSVRTAYCVYYYM